MKKYFLKCDISGIQTFIFNVASDGAARELKKRSIHVQDIAEECSNKLNFFFGNKSVEELYNGGGNFYLEISTDKAEQEIRDMIEEIQKEYLARDIFPYISFIEQTTEVYDKLLDKVNYAVQKAKMQRPVCFDLLKAAPEELPDVHVNKIKGINGQVPREEGDPSKIADFGEIANKSEGDKKLAALKLDVDNLGKLFKGLSKDDYKELSCRLKNFFNEELLKLIEELELKQHIYVVFSGGDDCFLIGTWEKILELAIELRKNFNKFQQDIRHKIKALREKEITFSAGIMVFDPHHPMLQMAEEVENALSASKNALSASKRSEEKNRVTLFGKTLLWTELEQVQKLASEFVDLIKNKEESKSLLMIFRLVYPKKKEMPKVWRLRYFLQRNIKNQNIVKSIFEDYSQALLKRYVCAGCPENPDIYLVASRWAELLMKENKQI
jgi:CRISPR-associated protein Csm1